MFQVRDNTLEYAIARAIITAINNLKSEGIPLASCWFHNWREEGSLCWEARSL